MGNRGTCPVCGSYSSSVLHDIESGSACSVCGCPNQFLRDYQDVLDTKETYAENRISKKLLEENDILIRENIILKTKIEKLIGIFGYEYDNEIISTMQKALKILHRGVLDD